MTTTRYEVFNLVRDSAGLDYKEKHFINTVESRGKMYGNWKNNAMVMGFKKDMFFATRTAVLDKGLVKATRRMDDTTVYEVDIEALREWKNDHPHSDIQNDDSDIQNEHSGIPNGHSDMSEPKVTHEGNSSKVTLKGNSVAKQPTQAEPVDKESLKEEEVSHAPANAGGSVASLPPTIDSLSVKDEDSLAIDFGDHSLIEAPKEPRETSRHSVYQNGWSDKPEDQIRAYAKAHSGKSRINLLIQRFEHGMYPDLTGDDWTRYALTKVGVSESLQDAQW
jgi:hypothetical protein